MTSSNPKRASVVRTLLAFAFVSTWTASAYAQRTAEDIASARQLYNDGITLRDKGDMTGALEKFRAAHALGDTPITGLELCRTYAALHRPVEAREACLEVGRIPLLKEETVRSRDARSDAARLAESEKGRIGGLRIKVTGAPQGAVPTVLVDGTAVPSAALSEPRAVNPGSHTVIAKIGDGPETRGTVDTTEGEVRAIELVVRAPERKHAATVPVVDQPAEASPKKAKKTNVLATTAFVTAGAAGVVGAVAGVVAISGKSHLECAANACGRDQWDALDSARRWGNVATASFVVAGVALGAGLLATLTAHSNARAAAAPKRNIDVAFGLGGAAVHGSF